MEPDEREEWVEAIRNELAQDLDTALDFLSAEFEGERSKAQRYYNGESDLKADANRSRYVATKVRDAVRSVRPSLMRTFLSCWHPVEFVPTSIRHAGVADLQTQWISQLFYDLGGYKTIYSAFHDAMLHKLGVVKYWYEDSHKPIYRKYTGLSEQQVQMLTAHPLIEVIAGEEHMLMQPGGQPVRTFDLEIVGKKPNGTIKMSYVPLNEFLIDRNATCKEDARVVAHRRNILRGDAIAMGFDAEDLDGLNADDVEISRFAEESYAKRGYTVYPTQDDTVDESMQKILLTEAYYRADLDGVGIPQLYRFWLGGTHYQLLDYERVDDIPFALFAIDPEPGTLFGKSLFDLTHSDQDVMTSLTRATVDNFHMTNNPRLAVHEHMVNMEDVLNNDLGSPIRVRSAGQIQVIQTPFTGGQALPLLQHIDQEHESKTGITKAASGLDPDAMQSTDKDAVRNTIQLAQGQVELMARNLAESGMVELFKGLLHLSMTHLDSHQLLRTPQGAQQIALDAFDPDMAMRVEVGTGTGNYDERMAMLNDIRAEQQMLMETLGPGNPIVTMQHMQNTRTDRMRMMGMYNPTRYFNYITPQQEQQLAQQMQQKAQQKEQTQKQIAGMQANALQQAEQIKAQAKVMTDREKNRLDLVKMERQNVLDTAELQQKEDADFRELMVKDDLARDQMLQDLYLAVMEMKADMIDKVQNAQRLN